MLDRMVWRRVILDPLAASADKREICGIHEPESKNFLDPRFGETLELFKSRVKPIPNPR